ncbi:MAG: DegT/DnrJ/EryC1/StrS family aminotransferase [Deltaproteobacteria bacterium]|nr:DegT/DnrJ/EryC1/StrS family aminotransferase [Deltaproteobacteria bacterium]
MKRSVEDLAIFGGTRTFAEDKHVGRPNLGDRAAFHKKIDEIFDRVWLTNDGPVVRELEARIANITGARHALAVCNATVGLELVAHGLELSGEVVLPAWTFVATAHAMRWVGLTPVFSDVERSTHHLSAELAARRITPRTTAILATHLWGEPCDVDALTALAKKHRLKLIFDAAHAFGVGVGQRPIGTFGDAEVFSFHGTKFVNSFEGGAITTNDDELARRLRLMRNFGFAGFDLVLHLGTNAKMHEASAAMALVNMDAMGVFMTANRVNLETYQQALADVPGVRLRRPSGNGQRNFQYVVAEVDEALTGVSRDDILAVLQAEGVIARRYFYPGAHRMEPYVSEEQPSLPMTEEIAAQVLILPTGTAMSPVDICLVTDLIRFVVAHGPAIAAARGSGAAAHMPPLRLPRS